MKKVLSYSILFIIVFAAAGCGLRKDFNKDDTKSFVITDSSTGKVTATYDYDVKTTQLKKTVVFDSEGEASRSVEYTFDEDGELREQIIQRPVGDSLETNVVDYTTRKFYDTQGRLVKTVQTSSTGEIIESFYGYDSSGELRGVVQRSEDGALMMMDY